MTAIASLSAGQLQIRYVRDSDRIRHVLGILIQNEFVSMFESVEGTSADAWPVSAPMQQIDEERIGNGDSPVLLGVGLSGHGHWSIAVDRKAAAGLQLDLACKISRPSVHLGSRYRWTDHVILKDSNPDSPQELSMELQGQSIVLTVMVGSLRIDSAKKWFEIVPSSDLSKAMTHRWCYQIQMK